MAPRQLDSGEIEAVHKAASELGVSPRDLAAVIGYETAGSYDPWQKGPTTKWGTHRGLIQFGTPQRKQYGVSEGQSFEDQLLNSVVPYLKDTGVRPGMGLAQIYSAINAGGLRSDGSPRYGASDVPGKNVRSHVQDIGRYWLPRAEQVMTYQGAPTPRLSGASQAASAQGNETEIQERILATLPPADAAQYRKALGLPPGPMGNISTGGLASHNAPPITQTIPGSAPIRSAHLTPGPSESSGSRPPPPPALPSRNNPSSMPFHARPEQFPGAGLSAAPSYRSVQVPNPAYKPPSPQVINGWRPSSMAMGLPGSPPDIPVASPPVVPKTITKRIPIPRMRPQRRKPAPAQPIRGKAAGRIVGGLLGGMLGGPVGGLLGAAGGGLLAGRGNPFSSIANTQTRIYNPSVTQAARPGSPSGGPSAPYVRGNLANGTPVTSYTMGGNTFTFSTDPDGRTRYY